MPKLEDIAKAANVSISTVSKALNNQSDVSEKTRKKIVEIAEAYNYTTPSSKKDETGNIGVIFCRDNQPLSMNPFYSRVLEGIEAELALNNYDLVLKLISANYSGGFPKSIDTKKIDGLIIVGALNEAFIKKIKTLKTSSILVDPKTYSENYTQVLIDNEHGAFIATQYLINKGHKRIGLISGDINRLSFSQRLDGYKKALKYNNINFLDKYIRTGGIESGYELTNQLLSVEPPPTAIFAANDINALHGYKAIKERSLRIPEDISVIGFDDINMAKISSPPLTTVRVYKEEIGSIAVRTLLKSLDDNNPKNMNTIMPIKLIKRESVQDITNQP
ncbi:MAG: LacI family transcriptional regulator [Candidatus Marinimicrobia bacterium]|nr:LacI family transcriptional regulator [Candidatus Neomarinimicrobiota bacterium]